MCRRSWDWNGDAALVDVGGVKNSVGGRRLRLPSPRLTSVSFLQYIGIRSRVFTALI